MPVLKREKLRAVLRTALPFLLIPAVVAFGAAFGEKLYSAASLAVTLLSLLLFAAGYENRKTGSRRMIICAVMTALSVAGRFIPLLKPVTALTVITGMHLGKEAGFLVGALSAVISNFYFGQGPWTPFQMLAWGMIGLVAGALTKPLRKSRALLLILGGLSGIAFSLIMDVWTVLWYNGGFSWELYLAGVVAALPHTLIYAVSNVAFLWLLAKPFGEKLNRIRLKYGV